jgi:hypothetical protein
LFPVVCFAERIDRSSSVDKHTVFHAGVIRTYGSPKKTHRTLPAPYDRVLLLCRGAGSALSKMPTVDRVNLS